MRFVVALAILAGAASAGCDAKVGGSVSELGVRDYALRAVKGCPPVPQDYCQRMCAGQKFLEPAELPSDGCLLVLLREVPRC